MVRTVESNPQIVMSFCISDNILGTSTSTNNTKMYTHTGITRTRRLDDVEQKAVLEGANRWVNRL